MEPGDDTTVTVEEDYSEYMPQAQEFMTALLEAGFSVQSVLERTLEYMVSYAPGMGWAGDQLFAAKITRWATHLCGIDNDAQQREYRAQQAKSGTKSGDMCDPYNVQSMHVDKHIRKRLYYERRTNASTCNAPGGRAGSSTNDTSPGGYYTNTRPPGGRRTRTHFPGRSAQTAFGSGQSAQAHESL